MLAFMVFAASRPEVLAQVQALTDAVALEAGEALPDLRETMAVQILSAEAKAQLKTLANFVEVILGKAVIEPDAPSNADVSSLENTTGCAISTRHLSRLEIVSSRAGRFRPYPIDPTLRFSEDFTEDVDALMNSACRMKMKG